MYTHNANILTSHSWCCVLEIMGALVHPCRTCWRLIRKEPAISDSDGILEPPPYSPYGPRDFANQPPPYMNHIASQPLGEWEESVTPINQPVTVQRESTTNQSELRIFTISSEERITGNEDSLGRGLEHRNSQSELTQHSVTQTVTQSSITTDSQDEDGPINPSTPSTGLLSCHESPSRDSLTGTVCEATLHQSQARVEPVTVENLAIVTRFWWNFHWELSYRKGPTVHYMQGFTCIEKVPVPVIRHTYFVTCLELSFNCI